MTTLRDEVLGIIAVHHDKGGITPENIRKASLITEHASRVGSVLQSLQQEKLISISVDLFVSLKPKK